MKYVMKMLRYSLATQFIFLFWPSNVLAAANTENNSLTAGQIIGGMCILIIAILLPIIRQSRKSGIR